MSGDHTGNFNHEVGHTRGLVDIYGTRDTIQYLTIMSDSWPVPPSDFTAFDRLDLGWIVPHVVAASTEDVELTDTTTTAPTAIEIPTGRAEEYFLIEYRKRLRPASARHRRSRSTGSPSTTCSSARIRTSIPRC